MDNHFDRRERTIYVWMLERSVTDDQLYTLFSKIGPIEKLIFKEYADGTPQHCLIVFRYVDSVLTAMSTLQGAELNGKPISLRPLRESTHAVLMPASTMYPSATTAANYTSTSAKTSNKKERTTTVTSSDGLSDHSADDNHNNNNNYGGGVGMKLRSNWDAASSAGSASSGIWNTEALETATEKLTLAGSGGGTMGSRSRTSFSSSVSSGVASPSNHSLSPPPLGHAQQLHHTAIGGGGVGPSAIHGSLRAKPWRPSRGPIPAPLLAPGGGGPRYNNNNNQYGGSSGGYGSHANLAGPPSLFSQLIPPSPGVASPSPYGGGTPLHHSSHSANASHAHFFGAGTGPAGAAPSPRPLFPEMYKSSTGGGGGGYGGRPAAPTGVFSPTAAPEEVVWRQHHNQQPPPPPLMSPPCTAGGKNWFDYGEYSVPQAYRGSATEQQLAAGGGHQAPPPSPLLLGGMLPPNSPPIGQCTPYFDFPCSDGSATLPRLRSHQLHNNNNNSMSGGYHPPPPSSARPSLLSPYGSGSTPFGSYRCAPRAPRSAAPFGANPMHQQHHSHHNPHHDSPFAWPEFGGGRNFGARF